MSVPYRPLGLIMEAVELMGLEVTHAYEDLVFISHNAFLLRMGSEGPQVYLYFNEDCEPEQRDPLSQQLGKLGAQFELNILRSGTYTMEQRDGEQVDIHFKEETPHQVPA